MKRSVHQRWIAACAIGAFAALLTLPTWATEVVLKDGRILRGRVGETIGLAEQGGAGQGDDIKQIIFVGDDFRLTFISKRQVAQYRPDTSLERAEKFDCEQPRDQIGRGLKVISVGPPAGPLAPFDEWGRRVYPMRTPGGVLNVVQVITELTPQYARVEALRINWDMRIATTTLSDEQLVKILKHQINPKNLDHRKKVVRFFLQCGRYGTALAMLQETIQDFNNDTQVVQELQPMLDRLQLMYSQQLLDELTLRQIGGQHALVQKLLAEFPTKGSSGEMLQSVRQVQQQYKECEQKRKAIDAAWQALLPQVEERIERAELAAALREIGPGLKPETLPRMAAFLINQNLPGLKVEEKLALAVSGWVLGADDASTDLPTALSAFRLRDLVANYLTETARIRRDRIMRDILSQPAAKPALLAALAAHMAPPFAFPKSIDKDIPGFFKMQVEALPEHPDGTYYVQLPPEYNPQRRYPMIVSLHGIGHDPTMQIDWWAGEHKPDKGLGRQGQTGRYGYIVIAPVWTVEHQKEYEYSAREHAVVLNCLRDACRRFAVDTDRVFLTGHFEGGDAAWDIGVSHPDLWAGVIPIAAEARKTCSFYTENARHVPFYVVLGGLDGGRVVRDAAVLDRYLKAGYNATVVEYLGRGHEHLLDEQLSLFDWMNRCKRSFPLPREREGFHEREFTCTTMRDCDNRFWWAEIESPPRLPIPRNVHPLLVRGVSAAANTLSLVAGNSRATIWLSPEMVDFKSGVNISVGGHRPSGVPAIIKPSIETMLEDLRVRGDRQHLFWAKVETK